MDFKSFYLNEIYNKEPYRHYIPASDKKVLLNLPPNKRYKYLMDKYNIGKDTAVNACCKPIKNSDKIDAEAIKKKSTPLFNREEYWDYWQKRDPFKIIKHNDSVIGYGKGWYAGADYIKRFGVMETDPEKRELIAQKIMATLPAMRGSLIKHLNSIHPRNWSKDARVDDVLSDTVFRLINTSSELVKFLDQPEEDFHRYLLGQVYTSAGTMLRDLKKRQTGRELGNYE